MDTGLTLALTRLAKGELFRIVDGRRKVVAVFHGRVWVTQHADPRDVVLEGGETFVLDRPGVAIVQALADASVLVYAPEPNLRSAQSGSAGGRPSAAPAPVRRMTAAELHREARRLRSAAIRDALSGLLAAPRRLWAHLAHGV